MGRLSLLILLDTHVWIWLNLAPERLSAPALDRLQKESALALSPVSIYETLVAIEKGRLPSEVEGPDLVEKWLADLPVTQIPITSEISVLARTLAFPHQDPFDRLIAASSFSRGIPLMTEDGILRNISWLNTIPAR